MTTIGTSTRRPAPHRIVTERVRLDACAREDDITVRTGPGSIWLGQVAIVNLKPIAGGRLQMKYRKRFQPGATVRKIDLDAGVIVEREREAVEADGPEAGVPVPQTAIVDGVRYVSTDPDVDIGQSIEMAQVERAMRTLGPLDPGSYLSGLLGALQSTQSAISLPAILSGGASRRL